MDRGLINNLSPNLKTTRYGSSVVTSINTSLVSCFVFAYHPPTGILAELVWRFRSLNLKNEGVILGRIDTGVVRTEYPTWLLVMYNSGVRSALWPVKSPFCKDKPIKLGLLRRMERELQITRSCCPPGISFNTTADSTCTTITRTPSKRSRSVSI